MFQLNEVKINYDDLNILIYGDPKKGKTTAAHFLSKGKPAAFLMTEDGHKGLAIRFFRVDTWKEFTNCVATIVRNKDDMRKHYSRIVVDLISDIDDTSISQVCKDLNIKTLGDVGYGKGYSLHKSEIRETLRSLMSVLPCTFICHAAEKTTGEGKTERKRLQPALSKSTYDFLLAKVDCIIYVDKNSTGKTTLSMRETPEVYADSRFKALTTQDFEIDLKNPNKTVEAINSLLNSSPSNNSQKLEKEVVNG